MPDQHQNAVPKELAELIASGSQEQVSAYIAKHFDELPQQMREEYMLSALNDALEEATRSRDEIAAIQEKGIEALKEVEEWGKSSEDPEPDGPVDN